MNWYLKVLSEYASIKGRARRQEFWTFYAVNLAISFCLGVIVGFLKAPSYISGIYSLAVFIPNIAVGIRRMQDTNHSGWWLLAPLYNIYLLAKPGDTFENTYGPDPKGEEPKVESHKAA